MPGEGPSATGRPAPPGGAPLRLLCWNVLKTGEDASRIVGLVEQHDPDVALFQELTEGHIEALRARWPERAWHQAEDCLARSAMAYLGILARPPVADTKLVTHNDGRKVTPTLLGRTMGWCEGLQHHAVTLRIAGTDVTVVNIHLSNAVAPRQRMIELEQIATTLYPDEGPLIVAGDFNSFAGTWMGWLCGWAAGYRLSDFRVREVDRVKEYAAAHGLRMADGEEVTLPMFALDLDHVLVRDVDVRSVRFLDKLHGSDHRPILADLEIAAATAAAPGPLERAAG